MSDLRSLLEREAGRYVQPDGAFQRLVHRRRRTLRNRRIAAGVVGIAVFAAAVWAVRDVASLGGGRTPANQPPIYGVGPIPTTDYVLDLRTGRMTSLPEGIVGRTNDRTGEYASSPDGTRLSYSAPGRDGTSQIFVANLDGSATQQVTAGLEAATSPAWSPDGSKIAYIGDEGDVPAAVYLLDLATGASTQLTTFRPGPVQVSDSPPSFTPDGTSVVYTVEHLPREDGAEIRIVPATGGASRRLAGGDGTVTGDGQLSPDGTHLSYDCNVLVGVDPHAVVNGICLADADGGNARVLVTGTVLPIPSARWSPDSTRLAFSSWLTYDVSVVEIRTGDRWRVGEGFGPAWLDDQTLIVQIDGCFDPVGGWRAPDCPR